MHKFLTTLVLLFSCLNPVFGQIPESGNISVESSVTGDIVIFSGEALALDLPDLNGSVSIDMVMNHNPATGQITGVADFTADMSSLGLSDAYAYGIEALSDITGRVSFSAKPVKRGSITSLAGAKFSETVSFQASMSGDAFTVSASAAFIFKKFDVDTAVSPAQLDALVHPTSFKVGVKGTILGRKVNRSVNMIDWLSDVPITSELADDNLAGIVVSIQNVKTVLKTGAVSGSATSLLNTQQSATASYKLSGKRNSKTGLTQLTLAGQTAETKGTSAILYVDDSLEVQTGSNLKNTFKAYGYSFTF
jgi:hypothetical protein